MNLFRAWGTILRGGLPTLSIEITRECPLRCPGCYAYEPEHLGDAGPLRSLADYRGQTLIDGVLHLVKTHRPVYVSIVGGEPLVRIRELNTLLPMLAARNIGVQLVTSAVSPIPRAWRDIHGLSVVVSIDGLQPEHDARRAPATYVRILKNIAGQLLTVHCTITRQMGRRPESFAEFLAYWSDRPEVRTIWFSLFTPQIGAVGEEILALPERRAILDELARLRPVFPKLYLPNPVLEGYRRPPASPDECIFARTTACFSSDLKTPITPCQFGGNPDCSQCGCMASAGMKSLGEYRLLRILPLRVIYEASDWIGKASQARSMAR